MGYAKQSQWNFRSNETLPLLSCKMGCKQDVRITCVNAYYRIAGTFKGENFREMVGNEKFVEKTFMDR